MVAQSRAVEGSVYREKKRAELGEEAFKARERKARAERRARAKLAKGEEKKEPEPEPEALLKLVLDKKAVALERGFTINVKSIKQQLVKVGNIYKAIKGESWDHTLGFLDDTKPVLEYIESHFKTPSSKSSNVFAITSILTVYPKFKKTYDVYYNAGLELKKDIDEIVDENQTPAKDIANTLPWSELKVLYKTPGLTPRDRAVIALYTLIPPRRNELGQFLTIAYEDDEKANRALNYLIVDEKTNMPDKIVLYKYKTFKVFGRQVLELPDELKHVLQDYINFENLHKGDTVFGTKKEGKPYKQFRVLNEALHKATNLDVTVNLLRHAKISDFLSTRRSLRDKKTLAKSMGHSVEIQSTYDRIDV
jgi:hypothetical protein